MSTGNNDPIKEAYEELMCFKSYTVASPWAVVIHSHDTFLTYATVMGSWWFESITFLTPSPKHKAFILFI